MNENSSRSHSIFILALTQKNLEDLKAKTSKLFLVDLAGSEKVSKTGASGLLLEEAKKINKSLTNLGMVITTLAEGRKGAHVPYRNSKLTRILQESLGGNSKTTLIVNISPDVSNEQETVSSLRFAMSAKKITNTAVINEELSEIELKKQVEESNAVIASLKRKITALKKELSGGEQASAEDDSDEVDNDVSHRSRDIEDREKEIERLEARIDILVGEMKEDSAKNEKSLREIQNLTLELGQRDDTIKDLQRELEEKRLSCDALVEETEALRKQTADLEAEKLMRRPSSAVGLRPGSRLSTSSDIAERSSEVEALSRLVEAQKQEIESLRQIQLAGMCNPESPMKAMGTDIQVMELMNQLNEQSVKFEEQRRLLLEDFQAKCQRVFELEEAIAEIQEASDEKKSLLDEQRIQMLEKNLEQLCQTQKELVDQNLNMKREVNISGKKLEARESRIKELEATVKQLQDFTFTIRSQYDKEVDALKAQLDQQKQQFIPEIRIVRPLRGGN